MEGNPLSYAAPVWIRSVIANSTQSGQCHCDPSVSSTVADSILWSWTPRNQGGPDRAQHRRVKSSGGHRISSPIAWGHFKIHEPWCQERGRRGEFCNPMALAVFQASKIGFAWAPNAVTAPLRSHSRDFLQQDGASRRAWCWFSGPAMWWSVWVMHVLCLSLHCWWRDVEFSVSVKIFCQRILKNFYIPKHFLHPPNKVAHPTVRTITQQLGPTIETVTAPSGTTRHAFQTRMRLAIDGISACDTISRRSMTVGLEWIPGGMLHHVGFGCSVRSLQHVCWKLHKVWWGSFSSRLVSHLRLLLRQRFRRIVSSSWTRIKMKNLKLDTYWHSSETKNHSVVQKSGMMHTWSNWTCDYVCIFHQTFSKSSPNPSEFPTSDSVDVVKLIV